MGDAHSHEGEGVPLLLVSLCFSVARADSNRQPRITGIHSPSDRPPPLVIRFFPLSSSPVSIRVDSSSFPKLPREVQPDSLSVDATAELRDRLTSRASCFSIS